MTAYAKNKVTKENVEVLTPEENYSETIDGSMSKLALFGGALNLYVYKEAQLNPVTIEPGNYSSASGGLPTEYFPIENLDKLTAFVELVSSTTELISLKSVTLYLDNNQIKISADIINHGSTRITSLAQRVNILIIEH